MTRILLAFLLLLGLAAPLHADGAPPDLTKLEQAATSGDANAAMSLGDAYRIGTGVEASAALALSWYEKAAELGRYEGYYYAAWHLTKRSQPGDLAKAVGCMTKAAAMCQAGGAEINCNISLMYRTLAEYQTLLARYADALKALDKAAMAAEALGSVPPIERAYLLPSRATIKNNLGKYQEALDGFQEALTLFTAEKDFGAIVQMNGASAVMATLWPIADDASVRLMADFYEGLSRKASTRPMHCGARGSPCCVGFRWRKSTSQRAARPTVKCGRKSRQLPPRP